MVEIIVPVLVVAFLFALITFTNSSSGPTQRHRRPRLSTEEKVAAIKALDLSLVRTKCAERNDWGSERALRAETEYREFLTILAEHPRETISPWSKDLDLFWHEHILDTKRYAEDCQRIFGKMVDHDPHIATDASRHRDAIKRTHVYRTLTPPTAPKVTPTDAKATGGSSDTTYMSNMVASVDCSSCGIGGGDTGHDHGSVCASGSDSHGHGGGHDGGGHGCSGHSCGGHSCGGHGCGGGSSCGGSCGGH